MLPLNIGSNNPLCKHEYSRDTFSNKKTLPIYSKEYFMRYILIQKFLWDIFWIKTHIWSSHLGPKQIFLSSSRETSDGKMLRELVDHKCDQQYCYQSLAIDKHCLVVVYYFSMTKWNWSKISWFWFTFWSPTQHMVQIFHVSQTCTNANFRVLGYYANRGVGVVV